MKQSTKTTNRAFMHNNIPYRYCYEEGGMIEIEKDIYTGSYEIMPPNKEMKGSYNSKMTKMIMEDILQKLAEKFSFQFTIRNRYRDKEEYLASVMIGNCDTTIFLGGSDSDTLKIVCERLGKETVKHLSFGNSKGRLGSVSVNKQEVGRELMSRIQVEQMSNTECLVFIRALRPFKVKKYRLENHPNYKYTAEADKSYLRPNPYLL